MDGLLVLAYSSRSSNFGHRADYRVRASESREGADQRERLLKDLFV